MIEYLKTAAVGLAAILALGLLPWTVAEARTGVLGTSQGSFAPVVETAAANPSVSKSPAAVGPVRYEGAKAYTGGKISLDFQNEDLHSILKILGEISGKNILVSEGISGKVTLKLKDVPWDQALDIVLASRNLGFDESGNTLTVYDLPTLQMVRDSRERERQRVQEREQKAKLNPPPLIKKVFSLKYVPVDTVAAELSKLKSLRGKLTVIGNDIYIEDEPGAVATMTQKFMRLDRAPRLVMIEVKIVEAGASFADAFGLRWIGGYAESGSFMEKADMNGGSGSEMGADSLVLGFVNKASGSVSNVDSQAGEKAEDGSRIISAPRFLTENDKGVSIKLGGQIPMKGGPSAVPALAAQLKSEEVELKVRPHIGENDQILTLDLKLINEKVDSAAEGAEASSRTAEKQLTVKDGQTVAIGGIKGGGGRWPLLGWLLNDRSLENTESEMLIFVTAKIIPANI